MRSRARKVACNVGRVLRRWLVLALTLSMPSLASTWYFSPTGSDSAAGTRAEPLLSIGAAAKSLAVPGDVFVLLDGVYPPLTVSCSTDQVPFGTAVRPFTVTADHERQALVQGDGLEPTLQVLGCSYWAFEGLALSSADATGANQTHSGALPVSRPSEWRFAAWCSAIQNHDIDGDELLLLDRTTATVVEDSEFYAFHFAAVTVSGGSADVLRRDYFNSRDYATAGPPTAIALAPCDSCIVENVVSEGNGPLAYLPGGTATPSVHNRVLGSISLNGQGGVLATANAGPTTPPADIEVRDLVSIEPTLAAVYAQGVEGVRCAQCTAFGGNDGFLAGLFTAPDGGMLSGGNPTFEAIDTLAIGAMFAGFDVDRGVDGGLAFTNAWDNGYDYIPMLDADAGTLRSQDAGFGACRVFVPATSAMKGAGSGGADIGANVLFRTVDGGLTQQPLWGADGAFPCGALVTGLNDVAEASCFDVHLRLEVGTAACPLPNTPTVDGGAPEVDGGTPPVSAFGLRCSAAGDAPWAWLAAALAWAQRRRRIRSAPSSRTC